MNEDHKSQQKLNDALIDAADAGKPNVIRKLLAQGANIQASHSHSRKTALHVASFQGHDKCVNVLLKAGAPVDALADGDTPLVMAIQSLDSAMTEKRLLILKALVDHGADVNVTLDYNKFRPLHYAVFGEYVDRVKKAQVVNAEFLIKNGADINAINENGNTALHIAAIGSNYFAIKYLTDNGIDYSIRNNEGKTALDILAEKKDKQIYFNHREIQHTDLDVFNFLNAIHEQDKLSGVIDASNEQNTNFKF